MWYFYVGGHLYTMIIQIAINVHSTFESFDISLYPPTKERAREPAISSKGLVLLPVFQHKIEACCKEYACKNL